MLKINNFLWSQGLCKYETWYWTQENPTNSEDTQQTSRNWHKIVIKTLCMKGYVTIIKCCANGKIDKKDVETTKCITNKHVAYITKDFDKGF